MNPEQEHTENLETEIELIDFSEWFSIEIDEFINQVESLIDTIPIVMTMVEARVDINIKKYKDFKKEGKVQDTERENVVKIKLEHFSEYKKLNKTIQASKTASHIIPRNFIVSLVSMYDAFLGKLIKLMLNIHPDILNQSDRQLTFSELSQFENLEEARDFIIEKEIETILRKSHHDQIKWLESKLSIPLRKDLLVYPTFIEVTERRNLFVHTNGRVSRQYLKNCVEHKVDFERELKIDDFLSASPYYINKAANAIFEMGVKLGHVIWRKLLPDELSKSDTHLNNLCYDLMFYGDTKLAKKVLNFGSEGIKKHGNQDTKLTMCINYALVHYLESDFKGCEKVLDKYDWSATKDKFQLAVSVLKKEYDQATKSMKRIGATNDEVNQISYMEWPLFDDFRKETKFQEAYKEIFEQEFQIIEREPKNFIKLMNRIEKRKLENEEE
jgi:hypothetical protein